MTERDHESSVGVEPIHRGDHNVPFGVGDHGRFGFGDRGVGRQRGDAEFGDPPSHPRPLMVACGVGNDAEEPRSKSPLGIDRSDGVPGALTRHLNHVVGVHWRTEDHDRDAERARPVAGNQLAIRIGIARPGVPEDVNIRFLDTFVLLGPVG